MYGKPTESTQEVSTPSIHAVLDKLSNQKEQECSKPAGSRPNPDRDWAARNLAGANHFIQGLDPANDPLGVVAVLEVRNNPAVHDSLAIRIARVAPTRPEFDSCPPVVPCDKQENSSIRSPIPNSPGIEQCCGIPVSVMSTNRGERRDGYHDDWRLRATLGSTRDRVNRCNVARTEKLGIVQDIASPRPGKDGDVLLGKADPDSKQNEANR